jgi:hypothetical protein
LKNLYASGRNLIMVPAKIRRRMVARALFLTLSFVLTLAFASCSSKQSGAEAAIHEYLKTHGGPDVKEVKIDLFHTDKQAPGKAYAGVVVTYTFGSRSGELQREYSGYILKREGDQWIVEENTNYTKEEQRASEILQGRKK